MPGDFEWQLGPAFERNEPSSAEAIGRLVAMSPRPLPPAYLDFLSWSNGGEGSVGDYYVSIWPAEEVLELNEGYEVRQYVPGLLAFGTDGGGEAFAFDYRREGSPIVRVPLGDLAYESVLDVASDLVAFLGGGR